MKSFPAIISESSYKDIPSVLFENEFIRLLFLPEHGGKAASILDRKSGREFLLQAPNTAYRKQPYDGNYTTGECSGFDDMFPTIDPVPYPDFPWKGAGMPDHGEVCALPWQWRRNGDSLEMSVDGLRFPYTLTKRISFIGERRIRIAYCARNRSGYPFEYIYASHLMLNVEDDGEILLPGAGKATWGFSRFPKGASYGDKLEWPIAILPDGRVSLDRTPELNPDGNNYKFFLEGALNSGWCGYRYPDGTLFRLNFSPKELPAFCLWVNDGSFHGFRNIALEPCSAAYDRIDIARLHGQRSIIAPFGCQEWTLELEISAQ